MEYVDLKLPKKKSTEQEKCCCSVALTDRDAYPYGLQLRLEDEQVAKLKNILLYKGGDKVQISALASIMSIECVEKQDGKKDYTVRLQIEKMQVDKPVEKMSMKEYRAMREEGKK